MTPGLAAIAPHVIALFWFSNGMLTEGHTVQSPPLPSLEACTKAMPAFIEANPDKPWHRGVARCVPATPVLPVTLVPE